jgi:ATP-binding cassette subfamily B protein
MASAPGGKSGLVYAPEKPFVFAGSIRHNLCLNQKFSDEELWSALDVVCLGDEARRMSSGLDNIVGEGGVSLSGGQRQRLALARIVLRASGLVLLDDPLSAVDVRTEAQIIGNLRSIWSDLTVVLTSNKQASLACCDISAQVTAKGLSFDATEAFVQNVTEEAVHV